MLSEDAVSIYLHKGSRITKLLLRDPRKGCGAMNEKEVGKGSPLYQVTSEQKIERVAGTYLL